jgi:hypothetical protein|tara:strand:- start:1330 stop:1539 length:210 start_codon:yes stop_codon:yes gene_type:complete
MQEMQATISTSTYQSIVDIIRVMNNQKSKKNKNRLIEQELHRTITLLLEKIVTLHADYAAVVNIFCHKE